MSPQDILGHVCITPPHSICEAVRVKNLSVCSKLGYVQGRSRFRMNCRCEVCVEMGFTIYEEYVSRTDRARLRLPSPSDTGSIRM